MESYKVVVVIPCFKVKRFILDAIGGIGTDVYKIIVVDDCCPEGTGTWVGENCTDKRVEIVRHDRNQGVGGAVMTGYEKALTFGADVVVKLDGDGQMDPALIPKLVAPILNGEADYSKGNRFFNLESVQEMPAIRLFGNGVLSFLTKISSGYWSVFDPTNGFTAIHAKLINLLPKDRIDSRYFFESDMLFRLNLLRAVVADVPMDAHYGEEVSNLRVSRVILPFAWGNFRNLFKRTIYSYFLRDFSLASLELVCGGWLVFSGGTFGLIKWWESSHTGLSVTSGTVMLSALPVLVGVQLLLSFINFDMTNVPRTPINKRL